MKIKNLVLVFGLLVFSFAFVSADVGLGVSPSKMREQIVSGETYEYELFVFNTGDQDIDVSFNPSEEFADFVEVLPSGMIIIPEPKPHELPLKNAESFTVIVEAPKVKDKTVYSGKISIVGGGVEGAKFGGNVAVSSQIEFIVVPAEGFLSKLSTVHYIVFSLIVFIVALSLLFRRIGFTIEFTKKKSVKRKSVKKKR